MQGHYYRLNGSIPRDVVEALRGLVLPDVPVGRPTRPRRNGHESAGAIAADLPDFGFLRPGAPVFGTRGGLGASSLH